MLKTRASVADIYACTHPEALKALDKFTPALGWLTMMWFLRGKFRIWQDGSITLLSDLHNCVIESFVCKMCIFNSSIHSLSWQLFIESLAVPRIVLSSRNEWALLIHRAPINLNTASASLPKADHSLLRGPSDFSSALPISWNKMLLPCSLQTNCVHKFTWLQLDILL